MPTASAPLVGGITIDVGRYEATLCRGSGAEFTGGTVVKKIKPGSRRQIPTVVEFADNSRGWTEVGKTRRTIRSMVVECFSWQTAIQIEEAVARSETGGLFQLVMPPMIAAVELTPTIYFTVRFFNADFEPQSRRGFRKQLFSATITDVEIMSESI